MSIKHPDAPVRGPTTVHLLRSQIEEAQRHTNSSAAAARWLNVTYKTYKKYATLYGIFERHLNPTGIGVDKGASKNPRSIPLRDILAGKHPKYSLAKLKNRLIARNKLPAECSLCGFNERRITDKKLPLILTFKDADRYNFDLTNLHLLCYNCAFLTTGAPTVVNRKIIPRSFNEPDRIPKRQSIDITPADYHDTHDSLYDTDIQLTEEERAALYNELEAS